MKIAIAAAPPFADDDFGAVGGEVAEYVAALAVVNDGARRHGDDEIGAVLAVAIGGAAAFAALRSPEFAINEGSEAVGIGVGAEDDAAAVAAVAAVGTAFGDVFFPAKTATAAAAVAALHEDFDAIDEHCWRFPLKLL